MNLDDSRFATLADGLLERIADTIDEALGDDIDAELQGGILTLSLETGGQYIINKNAPVKQIWLASPVSGAWHFVYTDGDWVSTREPRAMLRALLAQEIEDKFGVALEFGSPAPTPPAPPAPTKGGGKGG